MSNRLALESASRWHEITQGKLHPSELANGPDVKRTSGYIPAGKFRPFASIFVLLSTPGPKAKGHPPVTHVSWWNTFFLFAGKPFFAEFNEQRMLAALQKLAREREALLQRIAEYDAQIHQFKDEMARATYLNEEGQQLESLNERADSVYQDYLTAAQTHTTRWQGPAR